MSTYKFTHFTFAGLGEAVRYIMSYGGVEFEDCRESYGEWPKHKPKMPTTQTLVIDGKVYHQTKAICRYFAKKFDLYGSNDLEALEIDSCLDSIEDMRISSIKFLYDESVDRMSRSQEAAVENLHIYLGLFEKRVKLNDGFFVGGKMSYVDIFFASTVEAVFSLLERNDRLENYPTLEKLYNTVVEHPNIKAYIKNRSKSDFEINH